MVVKIKTRYVLGVYPGVDTSLCYKRKNIAGTVSPLLFLWCASLFVIRLSKPFNNDVCKSWKHVGMSSELFHRSLSSELLYPTYITHAVQ